MRDQIACNMIADQLIQEIIDEIDINSAQRYYDGQRIIQTSDGPEWFYIGEDKKLASKDKLAKMTILIEFWNWIYTKYGILAGSLSNTSHSFSATLRDAAEITVLGNTNSGKLSTNLLGDSTTLQYKVVLEDINAYLHSQEHKK